MGKGDVLKLQGWPAEKIAAEIVNQFSWGSNVSRDGHLIGQQYVVAEAIATAINRERAAVAEECAQIASLRITGDPRCKRAVRIAAEGIAAAIRDRFPPNPTSGDR